MKNAWGFAVVLLLALPPWTAHGAVIPISDVNADRPDGYPSLLDQVVTVVGVVPLPLASVKLVTSPSASLTTPTSVSLG